MKTIDEIDREAQREYDRAYAMQKDLTPDNIAETACAGYCQEGLHYRKELINALEDNAQMRWHRTKEMSDKDRENKRLRDENKRLRHGIMMLECIADAVGG